MTSPLRWVSVGYDPPDSHQPTAVVPGWDGMREYFVLQYFDPPGPGGEWKDVPHVYQGHEDDNEHDPSED